MIKYVEVEVDGCSKTTDKAALLAIDGEEYWIPFSQIEDNGEDIREFFSGSLYLTKWICDEKDISYFED